MANKNEARLIAKSLGGNHEAYGQLVDAYKHALYRHCFTILRDEDAAEDITQDTFIAAYYKLASYNEAYAFGTWLFKIGTNKSLDWLRRNPKVTDIDDDWNAIPSDLASPSAEAEYAEVREKVGRLQPNYQAVISLYYWHGHTYKDIAEIMEVPEGTVKGWLNRAKDILRKELA